VLLFVFGGAKGLKANDIHSLPHPPYSPNLVPSDYHLFGPMKKMLGGQKFASDIEVQPLFVSGLDSSQHRFVHQAFRSLLTDGTNV